MAASTLPISTYKACLMYKASEGGSYTKLCDIKSFPNLGGSPEMLETTTTSNDTQTFILGIQQVDNFEFTANYIKSDYSTIKALTGEYDFAVYFGDDGENGIFSWKGRVSVYVNGGGVNEVVEMTISVSPSTVITFA